MAGCEYCLETHIMLNRKLRHNKELFPQYEHLIRNFSGHIENSNWFIIGYDNARAYIEIKYCPMCGRDLIYYNPLKKLRNRIISKIKKILGFYKMNEKEF